MWEATKLLELFFSVSAALDEGHLRQICNRSILLYRGVSRVTSRRMCQNGRKLIASNGATLPAIIAELNVLFQVYFFFLLLSAPLRAAIMVVIPDLQRIFWKCQLSGTDKTEMQIGFWKFSAG